MTYQWLQNLAGKFIVFDGPDGSGKTTIFKRFITLAKNNSIPVCSVRDPGSTIIGEEIRDILLSNKHHMMNVNCEMLLYMASRAQLITETIAPALEKNQLVIADRFISSTLAYQGTAGGMSADDILTVARVSLAKHWPDLTVIFDIDEKNALERMNQPSLWNIKPTPDRIESKGSDYNRLIRKGYLQQVKNNPKHYILIDAKPNADSVFDSLCTALKNWTQNQN